MTYTLTIRAMPGNWRTHPDLRLRALLKAMKRGYGFSCESICPVSDDPKGPPDKDSVNSTELTKDFNGYWPQ